MICWSKFTIFQFLCQKKILFFREFEFLKFSSIPRHWDDLNVYNATLTHKINNKFHPFTNAEFGLMDHPRFGSIVTAIALKDIDVGTELFLDYSYDVNNTLIKKFVPWYVQQFKATVEYLRKEQVGEDVSNLPVP